MIKVFNIGAKLLLGAKEVMSAATHIVVCADKPNEITRLAIVRAKFLENLAGEFEVGMLKDEAFLTGLFSAIDLILDKGEILDFIVTPLNGKNVRSTKMYLTGMPLRPARATRIHLEMTMISEKKLNVIVSDMGFGEFFESSGLYWTTEIIME